MSNVLMIFPRFNGDSFWSLRAACEIYGARCPTAPLGLMTVAAMLPSDWNIKLIDRNAQTLKRRDLEWADMVMTGGMLPQRPDCLHLIDLCQAMGKPVVVGGPDAMSSPEAYAHADFLVCGEAEGLIDQFVEAWNGGMRRGHFRGEKFKVDVTRSPIPRFDLINPRNYFYVGVQFSRGCPFNCEFCDIIELYGRVPRSKTNEQMLAELQALYDRGYRGHVDFVDDNLIGNKKALKRFLPALESWQKERGYPFKFSTEASINLADDAELLDMMRRANFYVVFVGIESPDTNTLVAARKKQNTRRSLADSVHRIYDAGMMVLAGFIVGFDTEGQGTAEAMIECIEATSIPVCMIGMLTALPGTQLSRRLEKEGRLLPIQNNGGGDQCTSGLNFVTLRPRRHVLEDYKSVLKAVYDPAAYFERVRIVGRSLKRPGLAEKPVPALVVRSYITVLRLMWRVTFRADLRVHFWRTLTDVARHNPAALDQVFIQMIFYLHLGTFAQRVMQELDRQMATVDDGPLRVGNPPDPERRAGYGD